MRIALMDGSQSPNDRAATIAMLRELERKVLWLSSYMIHCANHERDTGVGAGPTDGLGHGPERRAGAHQDVDPVVGQPLECLEGGRLHDIGGAVPASPVEQVRLDPVDTGGARVGLLDQRREGADVGAGRVEEPDARHGDSLSRGAAAEPIRPRPSATASMRLTRGRSGAADE